MSSSSRSPRWYWAPIRPKFKTGTSFAEKMRALAAATIAAIPERRLAAGGRLTGIAYALTHDEIRARVLEITARSYEAGAEWLRAVADEREMAMPPEILVRVLHSMIEGLVFQKLLTPELFPDEVFYAAFAAMANPRESQPSGRTTDYSERGI